MLNLKVFASRVALSKRSALVDKYNDNGYIGNFVIQDLQLNNTMDGK